MPKIRIKHLKDSQLERYFAKSRETVEGVTTLTTSGVLNSNNKKILSNKFNLPARFSVEVLDSLGEGKYKNIDPFNDSNTLDFLTFDNNNTILGVPAIKLEGKNDFYITTDRHFLSLNEIPTESHNSLNENFLVSNSLIQTPNYVNFNSFQKNAETKPNILNQGQLRQNINETEYSPFVESSVFDYLSDEFLNESIVYENETYNVGDQQTINLTLDFTGSESAYLLNTTLFYKSGQKFNDLDNLQNVLPDTVFATSQVNLTSLTVPEAITSNFLPNVVWNNIDKRWEYNVIEQDENLHLNTYQYNNNNQSFFYPNAITNLHDFNTNADESVTISNTYKLIHDYIENSAICFTETYDRFNYLVDNPSLTKYNTVTNTYGFPNSAIWKTNPAHSISLENYLPGDFLVEKVVFEGNLDVKAEVPSKKGNYYNNLQNDPEYYDSVLYTNENEYNQDFSHNKNDSDYIISTVNFYLSRVDKDDSVTTIPKINGYQVKNNESSLTLADFVLTQNDNNPYIDVALSDLSGNYYYDSLPNDYNLGDTFKEGQKLLYKPIKNTIFESLKIDEFNKVTKNRKNRKFFYLTDPISPIDLSNESYVSIVKNVNYQTDIFSDLSNNDITKQLVETSHENFDKENSLDLITHNSISFIKTKTNSSKSSINLKDINSDVIVDAGINSTLSIDIDNYDFKVGSKLNKNEALTNNVSETLFGISSNYQYVENIPEILQSNILFYDYDKVLDLFAAMSAVNAGISDGSYFLGMPINYFVDYDGTNNNENGDFNIEFSNTNSQVVYTSNIQLNYNQAINAGIFTLDDCISSNTIIDDQPAGNFSLTKVNIAVLENNDFINYLVDKIPNFNNEGIVIDYTYRSDFDNRTFNVNQDSNISFYNLTLRMQSLCFIRLLDITLLNTKHSFESQTYYPFTEIKRHENDNNTVNILNYNIKKTFNYSTEIFLNSMLTNYYNVSGKVPLRLFTNNLDDFSIPAASYNYGKYLFTSDEFYGNFYRIIYKNVVDYNNNNDIQELGAIGFYKSPETINKSLEEEIGILNSTYRNASKRRLNVHKSLKNNEEDNISRSGKLINKADTSVYKENLSYVLKKNDEISVGVNSFSGFNNFISYTKLNKKLHITLIGRELHKKEKNTANENINITKAIIGSQRNEVLFTDNKFIRLNEDNKKYITDTILPGIGKVYSEIIKKDILTSNNDSFDSFINSDSFDRISQINELKSNRLIFTTKNRDNQKYANVIKDWHKNYYLSKNRNILNEKEIEHSVSYFKNKNKINKTFVYFDINSYSFNKKYSELMSSEIVKMNSELDSISNLAFTPCNFILPRDFEYSVFNAENEVVENLIKHPGLKIKYINDSSNRSYSFTKDSINKIVNSIKAFDIISKNNNVTLQYLTVPQKCVDSFNIDDTSFSNVHNFSDFRNSWCLVVSSPNISEDFKKGFLEFVKDVNKIDFYHSIDVNNKIYYDETFKLVGVPSNTDDYPTYLHNFYVVTHNDVIKNIVIPLSFLEDIQNTLTDYPEERLQNIMYSIDHTTINKLDYQNSSDSADVYNKIPYEPSDILNFGESSESYLVSSVLITTDFEFYLPTFELLYSVNNKLKSIVKNAMESVIYDKFNNNLKNKIDTGYHLSFYDKKVFTFNTEYLLLRELIKDNKKLTGSYYFNKKINRSYIYKKVGNSYVKTQNKLLYQISTKEIYNNADISVDSYIDCFGIERANVYTNKDIMCMLTYDINENDTIRIYDSQYKSQISILDKNYKAPYIEIDMSIENPVNSKPIIKYTHYSLDYDDVDNEEYQCYGSPICDVENKEIANKFLYSYSNNVKYHYPIDKTSGYRYGVFNPNPVKRSVVFNTNHYGQFKDKTYDTQNYATVEILNGKKFYKYTTVKKYVSDNFRFIDEETASTLSAFEGTNLDTYNRHYYPFVESSDGSDMSSLYLAEA